MSGKEYDSCIICFDDLEPGSGDLCTPNTCKHLFHKVCLAQWVKCSSTCPLCKAEIKHLNICCYNDAGELEDGGSVPVEEKKQAWYGDELDEKEWLCQICDQGHNEEVLLICDGCEKCFHTYCVGLNSIPDRGFQCNDCQTGGPPRLPDLQLAIAASYQTLVQHSILGVLHSSPPHSPPAGPPPPAPVDLTGFQLDPPVPPPRRPLPPPPRPLLDRPRVSGHSPAPTAATRKPARRRRFRRSSRFDRHRLHILIKRRMRRRGIGLKSFILPHDRPVVPKSKPDEQEEVERLLGFRPEIKRNPWAYTKDPKRPAIEHPLSQECLSATLTPRRQPKRRKRDPAERRANPPLRVPKRRRPRSNSSGEESSAKRSRSARLPNPTRDVFFDPPQHRDSSGSEDSSTTSGDSPIVDSAKKKRQRPNGRSPLRPPPPVDPFFTKPPGGSPELSPVDSSGGSERLQDDVKSPPSSRKKRKPPLTTSPLQQAVERKVTSVLRSVRQESQKRFRGLSEDDCRYIVHKAANVIYTRLSKKPGIERSSPSSLDKRLDHREAKIQTLVLSYAKKRVHGGKATTRHSPKKRS